MRHARALSLAAFCLIVPLLTSSRAADGAWAVDASGNWSAAANWSGGVLATGTDATAWFTNALTGARVVTNDLAGQRIGHLRFAGGAGAWTLAGGALSLTQSSGVSVLSVDSGSALVSAPLAGGPGVLKTGAGTLTLSGAATYQGTTVVSNGLLQLAGAPALVGFGTGLNWRVNNSAISSVPFANEQLTLTDGGASQARSVYHTTRQSIAGGFVQSMTYVASGSRTADGWTFVVHNDARGTNVIGASGGGLGISGITQSVAVAFNIYASSTIGVRLYTNGVAVGTNIQLAPVTLSGTNPVTMTLIHDPVALTLTLLCAEQATTNTKTLVFTNVNLQAVTKTNAVYVGFTGACGGSTAIQTVSGAASFFNDVLPVGTALVLPAGTALDLGGTGQALLSLSDGGTAGGAITNNSVAPAALGFAPTNGATTSFSGTIADGAGTNAITVVMMGSGVQALSGANSYRGGTYLAGGTLAVGADVNLGAPASVVSLAGGTLQAVGSFNFARSLQLPLIGSLDVAAGQTLGITNNVFLAGSTGTLVKAGAGTLSISQSGSFNPWTGPMIVNGGVVQLIGSGDQVGRGNSIVVNNGAELRLVGGNAIVNSCTITVNAGGVFNMNNAGEAFAYLVGSGSVSNLGQNGIYLDLGTASSTFNGVISGTGSLTNNEMALTLRGQNGASGVQVLGGANTFTGGVKLLAGTLSVSNDNNLGAAGEAVVISGGTLRVTGTAIPNLDSRPVNWSTFNGGLDIADTSHVFTVTNTIAGVGALTKLGGGTLVLTASNTFAGATTVSSGRLVIASGSALASTFISVNVAASLVLEAGTTMATNLTLNIVSNAAGTGRLHLSNGISMAVATLMINGAGQKIGTWGATGSGATFVDDNIFSGPGTLNVLTGLSGLPTDNAWAADASGNWGVPTNWIGGVIPAGTNATAYFTNTITADRVVTNSYVPLEIGGLVFSAQTNSWTLTGTALRLAVTSGVPTVEVRSNLATVSASAGGTQGLAKTGPGTLALSAGNTFSGETTVQQGTLTINGSGSLYNNGTSAGTVVVSNGATLQFGRTDTFGVHTSASPVAITVQAGALLQNTGAVFNTLKDLTLAGGELRANGGASTTFQAFQLKGTVTVSGAAAAITATAAANVNNQIQLGDNTTNGVTTLLVPDVTGSTAPDLSVSAGFANGRNVTNNANVASGFRQIGGGTVQLTGNNINTGTNTVDAGTLVVRGGSVNGPVNLINGAAMNAAAGPGLAGEFYATSATGAGGAANPNFLNPMLLATYLAPLNPNLLYNFPASGTNFDFDAGGLPLGVNSNLFTARWAGKFLAVTSGVYTFSTASDDGSMLWVDGTNVVNNNLFQGITSRVGTIDLTAGSHDLVIAQFNGGGTANMSATYQLPGSAVSNRIDNGITTAGPDIGSLLGDAASVVTISNTTLTVAQTVPATFPGSITGDGALRKLGLSTLTLTAANSITNWVLGAGRLAVSNDASLGGANSALSFEGGLLQVNGTGIANLNSHPISTASFVGGFDVADPAHTLSITQSLGVATGNSILWKSGAGTLSMVGSTQWLNGGFVVNTGTLVGQSATFINVSNVPNYVGQVAGDSGRLVLLGSSAVIKSNNQTIIGNAAGSTGSVLLAGSATMSAPAFNSLTIGNSGRGLLTVQDNAYVSNKLFVGSAAGGAGALHLRGGTVYNSDGSTQDSTVGLNTGAYGFFGVFGGIYSNRGWFWVGGNNGAGVMQQTGGTVLHLGVDGGFDISRGGTGVVQLAGGTFMLLTNNLNLNVNGNHSGLAILTVTTNASVIVSNGSVAVGNRSNQMSIVNLNGGSLRANQVYKQLGVASNVSIVNFDGGMLRGNVSGNLFNTGVNVPDQVNIYGGGATLDSGNQLALTVVPNLRAPTGSGLASVPVATAGSGYIGSPIVSITGGGGTGATAFAMVDFDTNSPTYGQLLNVLVTSPGQGYSSAPTVTLQGGGPVVAATLGTPTIAAVTSGGLTLTGSGSFSLLGTNTYSGNTVISNGIVLLASTNAVGAGGIVIAGNTAGIGPAFAIGQDFVNWLTSRTTVTSSGALLALGASSASNLNLTALTNWSLTAAGGGYTYSGNLTITGTNLYLGGGNGTLTYAPVIGSGTNVFVGLTGGSVSGVVVLSGANGGYTGAMQVVSGTLRGGAANAFGSSSSVVNVSNGTTLDVGGQNLGTVKVFVQGNGAGTNGAIMNSGASAIPGLQKVYLTGNATFGGPNRWDIRSGAMGPILDLAGFTLTKTNAIDQAMFNTEVTDGNILIAQGIFRFEQGTIVTAGVGRITVLPTGTLDFWALTGIVTRAVTVTGGTVTVGSGHAIVGSTFALDGPTNTFNIANGAYALSLTGVVSGAGALRKTGFGAMRLLETSVHTGATLVEGGQLEVTASNTVEGAIGHSAAIIVSNGALVVSASGSFLGTNRPPVVLRAGGFLSVSNGVYDTVPDTLTLAGGGLGGGAPEAIQGNWILRTNLVATTNALVTAARIQLAAGAGNLFDVAAGSTLGSGTSFENPVAAGTGSLTKAGAGTMILAGTSTYGGETAIAGGSLKLQNTPGPVAAGLSYWLDAADSASLVLDAAGRVIQWSDKSGNGLHFTQANAALRPQFLVAGVNGRPGLRFDGVTNRLGLDTLTTPQTVFIVNRPTLYSTLNGVWGSTNTADKGIRLTNATSWTAGGDGNDFSTGAGGSVFVNGATSSSFGVLGTVHVLTETRGASHTATYTNTTLGGYFPGRMYQGDIAEVLVYSTTLSANDRRQVEQYLYNKWFYGSAGATNNVLPGTTLVRMAGGTTLDLNGVSQTVGALADNGGAGQIVNSATGTAVVLTLGNGGASGSFSGSIGGGVDLSLVKIGSGTQVVNGIMAFDGEKTISNGVLLVNGSIGGTGFCYVTGGTLGGTGAVGGQILQQGGSIAPGASAGRLTFSNSCAQVSGSVDIEIAGTVQGVGYDHLDVRGGASFIGTLNVTTNGYNPVAGDSFTIITASNGLSASFSAINLPALDAGRGWTVQALPNAMVLSVTGAPPSTGYDLATTVITNGLSGYQDDADGDGYANLLEYVTGGSLTNAGNEAKMQGTRTNGLLALRFNRDTNAIDATIVVEGSGSAANSATWLGIATNIGGSWGAATNVVSAGTNSPLSETVYDTDSGTNRFLRLRVTRP